MLDTSTYVARNDTRGCDIPGTRFQLLTCASNLTISSHFMIPDWLQSRISLPMEIENDLISRDLKKESLDYWKFVVSMRQD